MPWNGTKARQHNGKFQKRGIEQKIADTHIETLNRALEQRVPVGMAYAMSEMAASDVMARERAKTDKAEK